MPDSMRSELVCALTNQVIGGQSVIYRLFREALGCEDRAIRRLELTYFACGVMTSFYLRLGKEADGEELLDRATLSILKKSIPESGEQISLGETVREFQIRYAEYDRLLSLVVERARSKAGSAEITLLLHLFECVTKSSARGKMLQIVAASALIGQFVIDHVEFIEQLKWAR
jgi:hypothetical protein